MSKDVLIEAFVSTTLTMILGGLIYRSSQQQARAVAARHYVLRYGLPLRSICAFGLLLISVSFIFAKFKPDSSKEDLGWVFAGGALIAFMLGFTIEVFTARVEYDESNIYTFTP